MIQREIEVNCGEEIIVRCKPVCEESKKNTNTNTNMSNLPFVNTSKNKNKNKNKTKKNNKNKKTNNVLKITTTNIQRIGKNIVPPTRNEINKPNIVPPTINPNVVSPINKPNVVPPTQPTQRKTLPNITNNTRRSTTKRANNLQ
jgi:hypothetical protein